MRAADLHIGMKVKHPQHGSGLVTSITEHVAEVTFQDGVKKLDPTPLEMDQSDTTVQIGGAVVPLGRFLKEVVLEAALRLEELHADGTVEQLALRWQSGALVMKPGDEKLQAKELPLEKFFHKIVMMRDNLRVLEQKINSNSKLADADKVELQQYITRCYGSMTSFNVLFKDKTGQFAGASE